VILGFFLRFLTIFPSPQLPMAQWQPVSWAIAGLLLVTGCRSAPPEPIAAPPSPSVSANPPAPSPTPTPSPNLYQRGLDRGASAASLSQNAQSRDDWRLVASLWQQAIEQLQAIPANSPDHGRAQQKIQEYQRNLTVAQSRADRPNTPVTPTPIADILPQTPPPTQRTAVPAQVAPRTNPTLQPVQGETVFRVPIVRRAGGTPVINVTFNGNQTFPMVLDTGASGTVITTAMANQLGVQPVGEARVNTASAANVTFPLGYVDSIQVGGAIAEDVLVAIASPQLPIGLLGQDFFRVFDVTIREQEVEFRPR